MRIKQFKEVIEEVASAHLSISLLCGRLNLNVTEERVKMLLSYLEQRQLDAHDHLLSYLSGAPESVRESWVEFALDQSFEQLCKESENGSELRIDDVMAKISLLEQKLIDMLSVIADKAASEECDLVFHDLVVAEQHRVKSMVHSCHRIEDI